MQDLISENKKISFESNEFHEISNEIEKLSKNAKYNIYHQYDLSKLEAPSAVILQVAIEEFCKNESGFYEKITEIESDFKGKTEFILSLIKL